MVRNEYQREAESSSALPEEGRLSLSGHALAALYLTVCLGPLALAAVVHVAPASAWELAAAALGLVALPAMAVQFFISGRFRSASGRLGIDRIMAFHKFAAWWILLAVILHPLLYVVPTVLDDPALGLERLTGYVSSPRFATGVVAWIAVLLLVIGAVLRERLPISYEAWRATHVVLAVVVLGGALNHAVSVGRFSVQGAVYWLWVAVAVSVLAAVVTLYGWRWLMLHRRPWRLASVTRLAERTWELDIQPTASTPPLSYQAGQFVWMTEGNRRFPLFDHPFSIADSPLRPGLSLIVKEVGDFTRGTGSLSPGTPIGIDGPHGDFVLEGRPADAILLIAGGAGIAPIMGILRDLVARRDPRPVRLAYAVGAPEMLACREEIEAAGDVLDIRILLVSETTDDGWTGDVGLLDRHRLEDILRGLDPSRCLAMICGPGGMVTAVSNALIDIGLPLDSVVYERFDYAADASSQEDRQHQRHCVALGMGLGLGVLLFALQ